MLIRTIMPASDEEARANLSRLMAENGEDATDLAWLSELIGRPRDYLRRYLKGGSPRRLADKDARDLARYLRVEPQLFGVPLDEAPPRRFAAPKRARR